MQIFNELRTDYHKEIQGWETNVRHINYTTVNSLCRKKNYVFQDGENFTIMINENRRAQSASALLKWGGRPN